MTDGKPRRILNDLTGRRYGYLTILHVLPSVGHGRNARWLAQCDCGTTLEVDGSGYTRKNRRPTPQSCGCKRGALKIATTGSHGMSQHPAYWVWRSMVDRCTLSTHQAWANYGGRGITVCAEWLRSFAAFWRDMGPTYVYGLTLDREKNNEGYSPENCRWVTYKTQARNTRKNRMVDTPRGRMLVVEASEVSGIGITTLLYRLDHGWPTSELFLPPDPSNSRRYS